MPPRLRSFPIIYLFSSMLRVYRRRGSGRAQVRSFLLPKNRGYSSRSFPIFPSRRFYTTTRTRRAGQDKDLSSSFKGDQTYTFGKLVHSERRFPYLFRYSLSCSRYCKFLFLSSWDLSPPRFLPHPSFGLQGSSLTLFALLKRFLPQSFHLGLSCPS